MEGRMGEEGRMGWMRRWKSELGDELIDGRTGWDYRHAKGCLSGKRIVEWTMSTFM